jgi:hypothetical protein
MISNGPLPAGQRGWGRWLIFAIVLVVQCWALYAPSIGGPSLFPGADKVVHTALFLAVTWAGIRVGLPARWLIGVLIADAVISELVQSALPARDGSFFDVLADLLGVYLGWLAARARGRPA